MCRWGKLTCDYYDYIRTTFGLDVGRVATLWLPRTPARGLQLGGSPVTGPARLQPEHSVRVPNEKPWNSARLGSCGRGVVVLV